ncbi:MAG: Lrp/AsnC family transcriptional regulator [Actinobacteria bacterium]|nr:Lrp/AsnC family transcriptional regulator [Actinomycetota bacterium]
MLSELDITIIKVLQDDLPLVEKPFKLIADKLGITEKRLLDKIEEYVAMGIIRRFGATLNHKKVGFIANAMVAWDVDDERIEEAGRLMTQFAEVSHCYQRPRNADWQYNLFTMIHGKTRKQCRQIVEKIARVVKVDKYKLLFTIEELKKSSIKYFT